MAQFNWTYLSDDGRRHAVGLYHGDRTGHVLVHLNAQVILIDFHVLQSKNYSFFIEDELCEIQLERKKDRFYYGFKINEEVDTPKNRERRAIERLHLRKGLMLAGVLVLCVTLFLFGLRSHNRRQMEGNRTHLLASNAGETVAKVSLTSESAQPLRISYSFVAQGRIYRGNSHLETAAPPNGLPVEAGDEFVIRYARRNPYVNEIDFRRPSRQQILRYRERAYEKHVGLHPTLEPARIRCVLDVLYDAKGLDAYADVYFQDTAPSLNARHNRRSYQALVSDPAVAKRLGEQCR